MPRQIQLQDKFRWLEDYERGITEAKIAKDTDHDLRTIRKGIEDARRARDIKTAHIEILKDALRNHQRNLLDHLQSLRNTMTVPRNNYHPLDWQDCIYPNERFNLLVKGLESEKVFTKRKRGETPEISIGYLLSQHLENDDTKVWTKLSQWEDAYSEFRQQRAYLQLEVIETMKKQFDIPIVIERDVVDPPYVYGYTIGDLLFSAVIDNRMGIAETPFDFSQIIIDPDNGTAYYDHTLLGESLDQKYPIQEKLEKAYLESRASDTLFNVIESTNNLMKISEGILPIIESILLAGYVTGRCEVCRRLGL